MRWYMYSSFNNKTKGGFNHDRYRAVTFLNETRSIIFITNREISAWLDAVEDKHLCQTLLDRITANCQIIRLTDR